MLWIKENRCDKRVQQLSDRALQYKIAIQIAPTATLDALTHHAHHQGVVAKVLHRHLALSLDEMLSDLHDEALLVVLDGVTDPHNLGACLRVADAMGVDAIIAPKDRSAKITAAVAKVACGAAESVPYILVTNLARTLQALKKQNFKVVGLSEEGSLPLFQCDARSSIAWVLGAEGTGLRQLTKRYCDEFVRLPMLGIVESLNVSVCAGIVLAESRRQREYTKPVSKNNAS